MPLLKNGNIVGLLVYLEKRKTRQFVGELRFDEEKKAFCFSYHRRYLISDNIIPLGPEFPLTKQHFESKDLFPSLNDRIPSRQNPAYRDYCYAMGITVKEENPIILLATIGKRGPSSFIFEPHYANDFNGGALKKYRMELNLTAREFADCFDITQAALTRIEQGKATGHEVLKRIELYYKFPEVALYQLQKKGGALHSDKQTKLREYFAQIINKQVGIHTSG